MILFECFIQVKQAQTTKYTNEKTAQFHDHSRGLLNSYLVGTPWR